MRMSAAGRALLTRLEGVRLDAYQDSAGIWTIGIGHTASAGAPAPRRGMTITAAEADAILARDLADTEAAVQRLVTVPLSQAQFDALASFTFNVGAGALKGSTLLRILNANDRAGAAAQFALWNKSGGKVVGGLTNRRRDEATLFRTGEYVGIDVDALGGEEPRPEPLPEIDVDARTIARLNLRDLPIVGSVERVLPDGQPVDIIDTWSRIRTIVDGQSVEGWVSSKYLSERA